MPPLRIRFLRKIGEIENLEGEEKKYKKKRKKRKIFFLGVTNKFLVLGKRELTTIKTTKIPPTKRREKIIENQQHPLINHK